MDIGKIQWNIEIAEEHRDKMMNGPLKEILNKYCESLDQIVTTLAIPTSFMAHGLRKSKAFHFSVQDAMTVVLDKNGSKEKDPKKTAKELVQYFEELIVNKEKTIIDEASTEIELLINKVPMLKELYINFGLNALVNSWTYSNCLMIN